MCDCKEVIAERDRLLDEQQRSLGIPRLVIRERKTKDFDPVELARLVEMTREPSP